MTVSSTNCRSPSSADGPAAGARRPEARGRFEEALARARGERERAAKPERAAPQSPASARPAPRASAPASSDERPRTPEVPGGTGPLPTIHRFDAPPGICDLQAALRAAPPAIAAALRQGAPPQLDLTFGTALSIDLRAGAQGLELSLRPAPALERAARVELPRLVESLRARGLRVARAEVRTGSGSGAGTPASPGAGPASRAR